MQDLTHTYNHARLGEEVPTWRTRQDQECWIEFTDFLAIEKLNVILILKNIEMHNDS